MRLLWATIMASLWWSAGDWLSATFGAIAGWFIGAMMEEPKLPMHAVSTKPAQWHGSPSKKIPFGRRRTWVRMEGIDPMNKYALEPGPRGEHARWWLKTQQKFDRRKTRWWASEMPPPISTMVVEDVELEHEVAGWLLTLYALWKMVGR